MWPALFLVTLAAAQTPVTSSGTGQPAGRNAATQVAVEQLAQSNRDLLDLLKKQQAVLEDLQFDRRLQSRQIQSLEERLEEAMTLNAQLQAKVARLEAAAALGVGSGAPAPAPAAAPPPVTNVAANPPAPPPAPEPPATYLPPPEGEGASGTKSWHRILALKGTDGQETGIFHIDGRTWRVLWHNQDKPGPSYANTSALFISAFPKDDTIPQKVCSKLGSGGDSTELIGPGNYYLKIEASGGSWELAVEDFR